MNDNTSEIQQADEQLPEPEKLASDELAALQDRFLRLGAEFENFKKRADRDRQSSVRFANESMLTDLLPVLDHLEQAVNAAGADSENPIVTGVKMVLKQFEDTLGRHGIKSFSALGENFDPNKHEAVAENEDPAAESGKVIQEYQKGYFLNERLVRPARVVVAK
ncbi:MAG: nucleotide exchange factor GrpE [Myxococcota bacterium]